MKKCCDTCIHKKVCDYWEKEAHPNDYGTYDGEPCMDYFPADVVPVVHGEWLDYHGDIKCSVCKTVYLDEIRYMNKSKNNEGEPLSRCPECGAKMDGGNE